MEHALTCNNLKCRKELSDRALVTTCSHLFCLECAQQLGLAVHPDGPGRNTCPACNAELSNPDDAVVTNLNPSEEYKTSVLSGLSPNIIMECAGRALSFWAYQTTQDVYYQQYLYKTLTEKYNQINVQLEKTVSDAKMEIESLQNRVKGMAAEHDKFRRKNEELAQAYREKSRKLLQTQELYDKVKRKAEIGQIQQAASEAVDSNFQGHQGLNHLHSVHGDSPGSGFGGRSSMPYIGQFGRAEGTQMNSGVSRSNLHQVGEGHRWPQAGLQHPSEFPTNTVPSGQRQPGNNVGRPAMFSVPNPPSFSGTPAPHSNANSLRGPLRVSPPNFGSQRAGLHGIGLTSGLKVSQPASVRGLDASVGHP